jgi:hypothetical protein
MNLCRPNWRRIQQLKYLPHDVSTDQPTSELLQTLLQEVNKKTREVHEWKEKHGASEHTRLKAEVEDQPALTIKFFEVLGNADPVPLYLRCEEPRVHNHNINKRELELLIQDVWREKELYNPHDLDHVHLADFLHIYLLRKHELQRVVAEWGYSINDGLQRHRYDGDVALFRAVLNGEVSEKAREDQMQMLKRLEQEMKVLDEQTNGDTKKGFLRRDAFASLLKNFFPLKNKNQLGNTLLTPLCYDCNITVTPLYHHCNTSIPPQRRATARSIWMIRETVLTTTLCSATVTAPTTRQVTPL